MVAIFIALTHHFAAWVAALAKKRLTAGKNLLP
jgi:hypothetical protein